jgi:hypothetical protein
MKFNMEEREKRGFFLKEICISKLYPISILTTST